MNVYNGLNAGCWNIMSRDGCPKFYQRTFEVFLKIIELDNRPGRWMVEEIRIYTYDTGVQTNCIVSEI